MARRRHQTGQLFLYEGKRVKIWYARWWEDVVVGGEVRRQRKFIRLGTLKQIPTARLAQRELERVLVRVNALDYRPTPLATFEQFADRWRGAVLPGWKPSSRTNAESHLRKYLKPFFGKMQLAQITREVVQGFLAPLAVSAKTKRNILMTLRSVWTTAKEWGYVQHEPFGRKMVPRTRRPERFFFTVEESEKVITAAQEPYRTFLWLAFETGLRAGELCGLRVEDFDLENCVVRVRQSVWRGKVQSTKSDAADREMPISPELVAHLAEWLRLWRPNTLRLLFATGKGTPWDSSLVVKRKIRPIFTAARVIVPRGIALHAFRHGLATEMDRRAVPLAVRQRRIGHSDIRVTLGSYTHPISADERLFVAQLGQKMAEVLDRNGQKTKAGPVFVAPEPALIQ